MKIPATASLVLAVALLAGNAVSVEAAEERSNALQDCWTTVGNTALESYDFTSEDQISFAWSARIENDCPGYTARLLVFECGEGIYKPGVFSITIEQIYGPIDADPSSPTQTFLLAQSPGTLPPGDWDWILVTECEDSGNGIPLSPDGDPDDVCGGSLGRAPGNPDGPVVFGPNATSVLDVDPGGDPTGRQPGETGMSRPWCFTVR